MLDKCPGSTFRIVPRKYRMIRLKFISKRGYSLSLFDFEKRISRKREEGDGGRVAPPIQFKYRLPLPVLDRGNSWVERRKERPAFYYRSLEPRENIFTSGRERKERRADRGAVAGWHEMTDPSSLSVYTPSIFVGANRAAV